MNFLNWFLPLAMFAALTAVLYAAQIIRKGARRKAAPAEPAKPRRSDAPHRSATPARIVFAVIGAALISGATWIAMQQVFVGHSRSAPLRDTVYVGQASWQWVLLFGGLGAGLLGSSLLGAEGWRARVAAIWLGCCLVAGGGGCLVLQYRMLHPAAAQRPQAHAPNAHGISQGKGLTLLFHMQ